MDSTVPEALKARKEAELCEVYLSSSRITLTSQFLFLSPRLPASHLADPSRDNSRQQLASLFIFIPDSSDHHTTDSPPFLKRRPKQNLNLVFAFINMGQRCTLS